MTVTWSAADLPRLDGRTAVVTGSNSGIGWHTALELARAGASVTMACRTLTKAEPAAERIREAVPDALVRVVPLDLASLESVRSFATAWQGALDLLVNNAGIAHVPVWTSTADGFEMQFGTNHLGHFALTALLLPKLLESPSGRVVTVSSIQHKQGNADVLAANPRERYRASRAYAQSKLANLVFALELHRRARANGSALVSAAAHPGVAATEVTSNFHGILAAVGPPAMKLLFPPAAAGARSSLYAAAVAPSGSYTGPQRMFESRGPIGPARINPVARDESVAAKLWDLSGQMTGVVWNWG